MHQLLKKLMYDCLSLEHNVPIYCPTCRKRLEGSRVLDIQNVDMDTIVEIEGHCKNEDAYLTITLRLE